MIEKEENLNETQNSKLSISVVMYRFYEMMLWLIFLLVNIPYTAVITIPYLFTGKDFITPLAKIYEKCQFKK